MTSVHSPIRMLHSAEALLDAREVEAALEVYRSAEACGADPNRCAAGRWFAYMLRGDFTAAWAESRAIRAGGEIDANCLWRGERIAGRRVMVRCLHGFGDAVQFFRYAPRLKTIAADAIWEVPPALLNAARCFRGVERVIPWEGAEMAADWDVQVEIMELPCIFHTRFAELPLATNYLHLPGEVVSSVTAKLGRRAAPRVGLAWAAGEWNRARSIPLKLLCSILERKGCEFWNLQGGPERRIARENGGSMELCDAEPCNSGILPLAAVIAQMDLVITVDTLAAHLAGALGVAAWVILQYAADWRWMTERSDSPWYPSLRLFRQPSRGDWLGAIECVKHALDGWQASQAEGVAA